MTKNALFWQKKCANVCKFQKKVLTLHRLLVQTLPKRLTLFIYVHVNKDETKKLCLLIIARQTRHTFAASLLTSGPSEKNASRL